MEMQEKEKQDSAEYTPLEVPEVVPGVTAVDYPEISDFLKNMKLKGSLFGFQKEDVFEKMQKLNSMYQARAQQMRDQARGQLGQVKKQHQEEMEAQPQEETEQRNRELAMVREEMDRLIERLHMLKSKVKAAEGEEQAG